MKKILAVDDEGDIRQLIKEALELEGYEVMTACCGTEAIGMACRRPELILLDINLPDLDGFEVCRRIRDDIGAPILFLTARTEERDRIRGFQSGGDDYIMKPFSVEELLVRVEAHFRREERRVKETNIYMEGDLTIDFSGCRILKDGKDVGLTKTEFQIAELLLTHRGQVFHKENIYESVRGYEGEADADVVMEHIRRIRKKLGKNGKDGYIGTVWGVGYKWIG